MVIIQFFNSVHMPSIRSLTISDFASIKCDMLNNYIYYFDDAHRRVILSLFPENVYFNDLLVYHYSHKYKCGVVLLDNVIKLNMCSRKSFFSYLLCLSLFNIGIGKDFSSCIFRNSWNDRRLSIDGYDFQRICLEGVI